MSKKEKSTNPEKEKSHDDETTKGRRSGVVPPMDKASKVQALSALQEQQAEEALAKAKQNVKEANIPPRLPGDIQRQTR